MREASARKERSEILLRARAVPINAHLPFIEDSTEAHERSIEQIAGRALALLLAAGHGQRRIDKVAFDRFVGRYAPDISAREQAFLDDPTPTPQVMANFTWGYEAAWVLLWSLGYIERLDWPEQPCNLSTLGPVLADKNKAALIAKAKPKSIDDVLNEADLVYRQHWAMRNAQLKGEAMPAGLNNDVIVERHRALNWLIQNEDWDEITTDT